MELQRKCKIIKKYVTAKVANKSIGDGNNLYPVGNRFVANDCKNENCEHYRRCKIEAFDALN